MQEVEIGGTSYRTGRLSAFDQFHVFRKLAPVISGLIETFSRAQNVAQSNDVAHKPDPEGSMLGNSDFWSSVGPVARAIAEMTQEDSEFILKTCLISCSRKTPPNNWTRVTTPQGHLMFEDIDLGTMLQLTYAVLEDNLGDFFRKGLANGSGAVQSLI